MERILISGINGRLGLIIKNTLRRSHDIVGHVRNECLTDKINSCNPDIIIDVTSSKSIKEHLTIYLQHQIPTIIGTSGLTPQESYEITTKCQFPLLIIPNFSKSFQNFLQQVKIIHKKYAAFKIVETHCNTKIDMPSGCSQFLSYILNNAPISSHRVNHYIAKHEVFFGAAQDGMILTHVIHQPSSFIPGVIDAINYIKTLKAGQVFIADSQ